MHRTRTASPACAPLRTRSRCWPRTAAVVLFALCLAAPAFAAWPHDATANLPVCTDAATQSSVVSAADGFGNTVVAWRDLRQGGGVIYAQRIRPNGTVSWAANGVPLCNQVTYAATPLIVADGAGGAIVAWEDGRPGNSYDLYAQRIDSTGALVWNGGGVPVCTADWTQHRAAIISDGSGGAILAWSDERANYAEDIYAQRVGANGVTRWPTNGVVVASTARYKFPPLLAPDGAGGAFVTWGDCRTQIAVYEAYVQHVSSTGAMQWTANGVRAMPGMDNQTDAAIVPDAAGGCIVVTYGPRGATASYDIGLQRMSSTGAARWGTSGATMAAGEGYRQAIGAIADGRGGAIVSWSVDNVDEGDVFVSRADSTGAMPWGAGGVTVCNASGQQWSGTLASDGAGGAVIAWEDHRNGTDADVYAQRVGAGGAIAWGANGVAMSLASADQTLPVATGDGAGGITAAWLDARNASADVYAQWLDASGRVGGPVTAVGPGAAPGGLSLAPIAPNPARGSALVRFTLPRGAHVRLALFDPAGRLVRTLLEDARPTGEQRETIALRDARGGALRAGLYFLRLDADGASRTQRVVALE